MLFKRSLQRYGQTPEPETPYQRAGQLWDERIGSARVQARSWRLAFFASTALSGGLAAGLIWQSLHGTVVPWVVEVDQLGKAQVVAPAIQDYKPTDAQIAWHLGRFIGNVRSVSTDPVLVKRNWLDAYDFATDQAATFLNEYARTNDPFAGIGQRSVSVEVTSIVRASDRSFQVKWREQTYERGSLVKTERWTAMLTVISRTPPNADALRRNPLGVFVEAIDWSRELEPQSQSPPPAVAAPSEPAAVMPPDDAAPIPTQPQGDPQ